MDKAVERVTKQHAFAITN